MAARWCRYGAIEELHGFAATLCQWRLAIGRKHLWQGPMAGSAISCRCRASLLTPGFGPWLELWASQRGGGTRPSSMHWPLCGHQAAGVGLPLMNEIKRFV